jgi:hypothetical protein
MIIINDTKKTYSEITGDDLDRFAAQMQQAQAPDAGRDGQSDA